MMLRRSLSLILLVACSPAANRNAQAEAQAQIELGSYTAEVTKCRLDARSAFEACVAKNEAKAECKGQAMVLFETCSCLSDIKFHHDAGGSCK